VTSPSIFRATPIEGDHDSRTDPPPRRPSRSGLLWLNLAILFVWQGSIHDLLPYPALQNWSTVFLATVLQALPFLVLGVGISGAIAAFVPTTWLARALPSHPGLSVPAAGLYGAVLPGCECSAAPVASRLVERGVAPAAALTFLLAAPAINPIVIVSTAVAFPGRPDMVVARFIASLLAAVIVGWIWARFADPKWLQIRMPSHTHGTGIDGFVATATTDFVQAGGYLVVGAALVATLQTLVPGRFLDSLGGSGIPASLVMAGLAVVLSICSEADAFVAAGLTQFSLTARLTFLVVGPMVDIKLVALQIGAFGRDFARRFAPLTFVVAIVVSLIVGRILL
jgi:uncharacterized protein